MRETALTGNYALSAFNFKDFDISNLSLQVNGKQVPYAPLVMNTKTGTGYTSTRGYFSLFSGTGKLYQNIGNGITIIDWNDNGQLLFAFDLRPEATSDCFTQPRSGNIRLSLRFDNALTQVVTLIVYAEFENTISIDKNRSVLLDWA